MQSSPPPLNCRNIKVPFLWIAQKLTTKFTKKNKEHEALSFSVVNSYIKTPVISAYGRNKLTIFNRWGSVVFESTNYNNTTNVFKGIGNDGSELPPDTYYYSIELSSGAPKRTGFISLRK